eukprot:10321759-Lingulodinium_polyedra.AAC.1
MGVPPVAPAPWRSLPLPWPPSILEQRPLPEAGFPLGKGSETPGGPPRPTLPDKASCDESR